MKPLLIELGTEELPVKALPGLAQAFFDGVVAALQKRGVGLEVGDARPLYTPRRLAVLLPAVATEQPEQASEVLGPYLNIALDADGKPTRALEGFAASPGTSAAVATAAKARGANRIVAAAKSPVAAVDAAFSASLPQSSSTLAAEQTALARGHAYEDFSPNDDMDAALELLFAD